MRDYDSLFNRLLGDLGLATKPDGHIFTDMSDLDAASVSLASSFYKKLCPSGNSEAADRAALEKFERINARLPENHWEFDAENESESCFYDYFKNNLAVALQPECTPLTGRVAQDNDTFEIEETFDLEFIRETIMVGPGAAQKADSTSMIHKLFESEMSYLSPYLIGLYRSALAGTGLWAEAEMQRFNKYGFVKVQGGKIFFAAKNAEISRTCCTEPSLEMLFQKAVGAFLELRLERHFGISLDAQPDNNRRLARQGSIDGSIGTIDLVSASDSIGLQPFLRYFPQGRVKTMILNSRSETAVLPDGREVGLRMVSTMGNGFTFPLQTIIFASVVRAVYQLMGFPSNCPRTEFGVFGDDICVRKEAYEFTCKMLHKLGFEVNVGKSFNTGPFRESCGHDYTNGCNIRGVYVVSLETPQEVISIMNRLLRWGAVHGLYLKATLTELRGWLTKRILRVPPSESDDAGLHVPESLMPSTKVNARYWYQYRCYVRRVKRLDIVDQQRFARENLDNHGDLVSFTDEAIGVGFLSGHLRRRDFLPELTDSNPWSSKDGWGISIALRDRIGARARYKIVPKEIPYWNYRINPKIFGETMKEAEGRRRWEATSHIRWEADVVATLANS